MQESISKGRLKNDEYSNKIITIITEIKQSLQNNSIAPQTAMTEFSLNDYITYVEKQNDKKYGDEIKALSDYYVQQDMIRVDTIKWNSKNTHRNAGNTVFDFDDFFGDQVEFSAIIGAPFRDWKNRA